ncbi:SDR family NAD(P)-dependent oxidoreductase [Ramlibacter sp.]|uniref:SDR family NAD(P)-dependent oxidoreductase n=1 Tax=Ramlibacter sp. TaxID=1917967 RepID=UPI00181B1854|nr:SDR family NAD(P)-dependent oxidoreductase [Ramlibacter sp.]MBA2674563.1 SDR family oxidoreductase [Ramlibacter sp.]
MAPQTPPATLPSSVLVTGAASGIGRATVVHLLQCGVRVIAADRDADGLSTLVRESGGEIASFVCDLAQPAARAQLFHEAAALGYEGAVNCAGTEGRPDALVAQDAETLDRVLDVNLRATVHALRAQLLHLLPKRRGSIVNLASIYGLRGQPRWVVYSASKAGVIGLTQGAALEAAQGGVRVNAVAPGPIDTPLLRRATHEQLQRTAAMVPMKRNGQPHEVVQAIAWLLSDASGYVTGAVLPVDGGMAAQAATQPELPSTESLSTLEPST